MCQARITKNSHNRLKKYTGHQALMGTEKYFNSFVRSNHNIPELLMYGNEISTMSSSFWLRQCLSQGYVYNQCCWKHKFKFQKSYKKGAFPKENTLLKLLYLKITKLYKKWNGSKLQNWAAMVRNQLAANEKSVPVSKNTST